MGSQGDRSLTWVSDVAPASWIEGRLHAFAQDVGSVIPEGFEAYARIFHPIVTPDGHRERWRDLARRNRRIAHPEMQLHMINRPAGDPARKGYQPGHGPSWGSLPVEERRVLVEMLDARTTTPDRCWFCVWEGYGGINDQGISAHVALPQRRYFLAFAPVGAANASVLGRPFDQSPNLWWPNDRAWFVATEVDYAWTYVGGTRKLIETLLAEDRLEALPARLSDKPFYESDLVNAALDGSDRG